MEMRSSLWLGVQGPGIPHGGIRQKRQQARRQGFPAVQRVERLRLRRDDAHQWLCRIRLPDLAGILVEGGSRKRDKDECSPYVGPVYAQATNKCVKYTGAIAYVDNGIFWDSCTSGFGHCG
jgi:hypothetical protein